VNLEIILKRERKLTDPNLISAADCKFEPFPQSRGEGDSGPLMLATDVNAPGERYVVKSRYPEIPANEFMYHKIAAALGLHTQKARLFKNFPGCKYAVAIMFCPAAEAYSPARRPDIDPTDYFKFLALYEILSEADSNEIYLDGDNRVFKLDNSAAFNLDGLLMILLLKKTRSPWIRKAIDEKIGKYLEAAETQNYSILLEILRERCGETAVNVCATEFRRFAALDLASLDEAFASLDKVYPKTVSDYLRRFLSVRQAACAKFSEANAAHPERA
jgi:hypothetical protein